MTPKLRRSHRLIWLVLAVLLPLGLLAALLLPKTGISIKANPATIIHQRMSSPTQP